MNRHDKSTEPQTGGPLDPHARAFFLKEGISTSRPVKFPGICTHRPVQLPYCQNFHPSMPVKYGIRTDHEHRNFHRPVCCKCLGAETPTDRSVQIPVVYLARNLAQTDPCICSEYGRTASTDRSCIFGASMKTHADLPLHCTFE